MHLNHRLKVLPLLASLALATQARAQFNYQINGGTVMITGYTDTNPAVVIPDSIVGLPVTAIGSYVFAGNTLVTSVSLPSTLTNIGNAVFDTPNLSAINVSAGNPVFDSVDGVLFAKRRTQLFKFPTAKAADYLIPTGTTDVGPSAFAACGNLHSVGIPDTVTNLSGNAFGNCQNLVSVIMGSNVLNIADAAFQYCSSLPNVVIGSGVITIGAASFWISTNLTNVTFGTNLKSIGGDAFSGCTSLTEVALPASVTNGSGAFSFCSALKAFTVDTNNPALSSNDGVLFNKSQTILLACPEAKSGDYAIPETVTTVGGFWHCSHITRITIPDSVASIGPYAFWGCSGVLAYDVGPLNPFYSSVDGVLFTKIPTNLLQYPGGRSGQHTIPEGVTDIGQGAFYYCTTLTTITFPASVARIGSGAFYFCYDLTALRFRGNAPDISNGPIFLYGDSTTYYLPRAIGWQSDFGGRNTALWLPELLNGDAGVRTNQFGFTINWTHGRTVVVEGSSSLSQGTWSAISTNIFSDDALYFSDPNWKRYPARFYRVRTP